MIAETDTSHLLSDGRVADWASVVINREASMAVRDARALAREVQERRALDAARRCKSCAHGLQFMLLPRDSIAPEFWIECSQHEEESYAPDYYCADWMPHD